MRGNRRFKYIAYQRMNGDHGAISPRAVISQARALHLMPPLLIGAAKISSGQLSSPASPGPDGKMRRRKPGLRVVLLARGPMRTFARLPASVLPVPVSAADPFQPVHLDDAARETPTIALGQCSARGASDG